MTTTNQAVETTEQTVQEVIASMWAMTLPELQADIASRPKPTDEEEAAFEAFKASQRGTSLPSGAAG